MFKSCHSLKLNISDVGKRPTGLFPLADVALQDAAGS